MISKADLNIKEQLLNQEKIGIKELPVSVKM
jgi:hypothetical protein